MFEIILSIDVISAICIIVLVLVQQGKGANMGVSFGAGASNTLFGSKGSASFLFKLTCFFVAIFFVANVSLSYISKSSHQLSEEDQVEQLSKYDQNIYNQQVGDIDASVKPAKDTTKK